MDQVAQVRERIDIVSLISEYITVKKAGRNFNALCPFHGEKSPSFVVSPERQIWHCFGCGKGGDCFTFVMEYEHMEFPEALRLLAKKAGVELVTSGFETSQSSKKERLYKINAIAVEFYHYILMHLPAGKIARDYLSGRGVDTKLWETFKLGFAPASGKALSRYLLQKKQLDLEDVVEAGLVNQRGRDTYDFFRNRLIFPLIDHRDNVLGFSGRLFDEASGMGGKYINTRDTLVYHKREHFFGFNVTKDAIRKESQAILVEGEFDVMSCFQYGIPNVLAVKGTALTDQQVALLSRYAQKVSICFDGDKAGQEAIKRSLPILEKKGVNTTIIVIPTGKDPDEALKTDVGEFKRALKQDVNVYDYLFDSAIKNNPPTSPEGKRKIGEALLPLINSMENAIVKEHYLRKLSKSIETTYESIIKEMDRLRSQEHATVHVPVARTQRSREEVLEEYLIALIIQSAQPKDALTRVSEILGDSLAKERAYQKLLVQLLTHVKHKDEFDQKQFGLSLPQELTPAYDTSLLLPLPMMENNEKQQIEVAKVAQQLKILYLKEKLKGLGDKIKKAEKEGREEDVASLNAEYSQLITLLKK